MNIQTKIHYGMEHYGRLKISLCITAVITFVVKDIFYIIVFVFVIKIEIRRELMVIG
jgi:hypothetical protein